VKTAHRQIGLGPDHRRAGDEARDAVAVGHGAKRRAGGHDRADGILAAARLDQKPRGEQPELRSIVEEADSALQAARRPPGVIIAEGHVLCRGGKDPGGPAGGAEVAPERDHPHVRPAAADLLGSAVGGAIVDHDDRHIVRQRGQPVERLAERRVPVASDDHDADPVVLRRGGHRSAIPARRPLIPARRGES